MTVLDVITHCDTIKQNSYEYAQKRKWLNEIESDIRRYASLYSSCKPDFSFVLSENPKLFLDEEYLELYAYYIISMIDLSNQEYALYNNSSAFYNDRFRKWQKEYRRNNLPERVSSITL